jgi:hypothetical protein
VRARAVLATAAAALTLAGCHDPVTEVVVVIDTDLSLPAEADTLEVQVTSPRGTQTFTYGQVSAPTGPNALPKFPATIGVVPSDGSEALFTVTATLLLTPNDPRFGNQVVVARKATDVRFVHGQTRMLFVSLLRACRCVGTSCPDPRGTTECSDLAGPTLADFDPGHLPRATSSDGGVRPDAAPGDGSAPDGAADRPSGDGSTDVLPEALFDRRADLTSERASDAPPLPDGPPEASVDARDAADASGAADARDAAEASAPLPRGHVCTAAGQCLDGFCVDGVCCENACACGTCGGATPGTCALAAAGTDPRDVCGSFTCDGAGACAASCPEIFGACSNRCKIGAFCDGQGKCVPSTGGAGSFCIADSCLCKAGLTCPPPDGGGAGTCR